MLRAQLCCVEYFRPDASGGDCWCAQHNSAGKFGQERHQAGLFPLRGLCRVSSAIFWWRNFIQGSSLALDADFQIVTGCAQIGMSQPFLYEHDIGPAFEQVQCDGVAKDVRGDAPAL